MVAPCTATELLAPLTPSSQGVVDAPPTGAGCTLPPPGPLRKVSLIVRDSVRTDVGPYEVSLPGYATEGTPDSYRPFLIEAEPGDTLRIDLKNELAPGSADATLNLHTHGLVVTPRPHDPCLVPGDYIFDAIDPGKTFRYQIDIPTDVHDIGGRGRRPFPTGLYWFHSHLHGSSKHHVQAGQAGIIAIKAKSGPPPSIEDDAAAAVRRGADEKYLVLRDIQLAVPQGQTPDLASAKGKKGTLITNDDYDTQACRQPANAATVTTGNGFCSHPGLAAPIDGVDASSDTVWLFTINGQLYPDITVPAGRTQVWRVANISATITYVLDLVDASMAEQDLHLLSLDGVVTGTRDRADPSRQHPAIRLKRVLLMPGSRAEILVPNLATSPDDRLFVLRTRGMETGGANQPIPTDPDTARADYIGDPWPALSLARIVMKGSGAPADLAALLAPSFSRDTAAATPAALQAEPRLAVPKQPPNCVVLANDTLRRRISFTQTDTDFRLGSEIVTGDGTPVDPTANSIADSVFTHVDPPESIKHVCAKLGTEEVWELLNKTNELHNFHIHQTKFRLARHSDKGLPAGFTEKDAMVDPANVIRDQVPEFGAAHPVNEVDVWHDTIPVPPAKVDPVTGALTPGQVFIRIPFKDRVQVGTFVFHCHILEHEDKGMMATIQVFDPKGMASLVAPERRGDLYSPRSTAAFCGRGPLPVDWQPPAEAPSKAGWVRTLATAWSMLAPDARQR